MFGRSKKHESGITLIASNCEVVGDVHFSDELQVNGVIRGNVEAEVGSKARVRVSEKGRVRGEIRVPNVVIDGKVFGDIHSDKHVELASKAEVAGDVYYNLIEMVMGSRVDGNLVHVRDGKDRTSTDATEVSTRDGKEKDARDERSSRPQSQPSAQVTSVKSKQA